MHTTEKYRGAPSPAGPIPSRYFIADIFSGCGGLSLGFALTGRFLVTLGCDINKPALETFIKNHTNRGDGDPIRLEEDIRRVAPIEVLRLLAKFDITPGKLDCLIGGPPCEGFSQNRSLNSGGKTTPGVSSRTHKFIDDPRNQLFKWFIQLAESLQPSVLLIENVPDIVRHRDGATMNEILQALSSAGYVASARILNAADFGVPQIRRRTFFLAQRRADYDETTLRLEFPRGTHRPFEFGHDYLDDDPNWFPGDSGYWTTVREAIGDLPSASADDDFDHSAHGYPDVRITALRNFLRAGSMSVPYNHIARSLGANGLKRVRAIRPGQRADALPPELRPASHYHYSYARLRWSEPARTITKFAYHVGSGMFTHPSEDRAITMREAARLQSFPDTYRFYSDNIRETSAMIGSAVPPLLASAIGRQVAQYLDQLAYIRLDPSERARVKAQTSDAVVRRLEQESWTNGEEQPAQLSLTTRSDE